MTVDVFISYRGADRVLARKLEQRLRSRWGSRVFRDGTGLMPGQDWAEQLQFAMTQARVMLALVGPGWQVRDEGDGEDWVRNELLGAVEAGVPVLPVLIGDPEVLAQRLTKLPRAFTNQAVKVSEDLAGFDLHRIVKALRDLGAFPDADHQGLGEQRADMVPPGGLEQALKGLRSGRSILMTGASGSGRTTLLRQTVAAAEIEDRFVAAHGLHQRARNRRTHAVMASWIDAIGSSIERLPTTAERERYGRALVEAVLERGPDLLGRKVIRPGTLLPLGDDRNDRDILDAARRPLDRWAPFPPERLVRQSRGVLEQFMAGTDRPLTLVVDHVEAVDGSSADLINLLVRSPIAKCNLILATAVDADEADLAGLDPADLGEFQTISLDSPEIWGKPGAIIHSWLDRHGVSLDSELTKAFNEPNPYYALSSLWYLVDNGHVVEEPDETSVDRARWVKSTPEPLVIPTRDRLLDHMVEEHLPIGLRPTIEAGSLIGRSFPFSAAYAAACPPKTHDDEPPTSRAIELWRRDADQVWDQLSGGVSQFGEEAVPIDPDGSVIACHLTHDGERIVTLAQADLVPHFAQNLGARDSLKYHTRLASYFDAPFGVDVGESLDDTYRQAESAARHWAAALRPRPAADAHRKAAEIAEQGLAYREARHHYQLAIRLLTQLIAENVPDRPMAVDDHEDLLILANCLYRLGQMTRLAAQRNGREVSDPVGYLENALERLQQLSDQLHDQRLAAPASNTGSTTSPRGIPEPNIIRHHIRLCQAVSGYVNLELAEWYETQGQPRRARELLFDTLRHAEAARGEAGSRWLLAATSARLAQQLVSEAIEVRRREPLRSHNLAIEAQFHIERVIGLKAVSPDEDRDLDDPRSRAWRVLGQIFQRLEVEPQMAEWAFRRMNDHRQAVSDTIDMMTDRQLGDFLLSKCRAITEDEDPRAEAERQETRRLLDGHARWATESGISQANSTAYISLALLDFIEQFGTDEADFTAAHEHVATAIKLSDNDGDRANGYFFEGLLRAVEKGTGGELAVEDPEVAAAFNLALGGSRTDPVSGLLECGWKQVILRLLPSCPQLAEPVKAAVQRWYEKDFEDVTSELRFAIDQADLYVERCSNEPGLQPSHDRALWRLLEGRVPRECLEHAKRTRTRGDRIFEVHGEEICGHQFHSTTSTDIELLRRDIHYAAAIHDWYRSTDPTRLLTLAREQNARISGAEWASPNLLRGRLALSVLEHQYLAASEIGRERFDRISAMVENRFAADDDASPLEQFFFLASQLAEPDHAARVPTKAVEAEEWREVVFQPGRLEDAYVLAVAEHKALVRQAGLPLVQDLHLLDVSLVIEDHDEREDDIVDLSEKSRNGQTPRPKSQRVTSPPD